MSPSPARSMCVLALVTLAGAVAPAQAALVCAHTGDAIQAALEQVNLGGEDTTIRIVAGTYTRQYSIGIGEHAVQIDISGGWNASCSAQTGGDTILDGQNARQIFYLDSFGSARATLRISRLWFINGQAPDSTLGGAPGGLDLWGTSGITIEQSVFVGNHADTHTPAALAVHGPISGLLVLRNNLFIANSGQHAIGINDSTPVALIAGNTIIDNTSTASSTGGLVLDGSAAYVIANNILWNNSGGDLYLDGSGVQGLFHNDIGVLGGTPPSTGSEGNVSVEPGFGGGLVNLSLAPDSPLVNRGFDLSEADLGATDLVGAQRLQGAHVDIGAFESDVLFRDGVDPL